MAVAHLTCFHVLFACHLLNYFRENAETSSRKGGGGGGGGDSKESHFS